MCTIVKLLLVSCFVPILRGHSVIGLVCVPIVCGVIPIRTGKNWQLEIEVDGRKEGEGAQRQSHRTRGIYNGRIEEEHL